MPPTNQYRLNRALFHLEAIVVNQKGISQGDVLNNIRIAIDEIKNVLHQLDAETGTRK
jgi:hypothetical protein